MFKKLGIVSFVQWVVGLIALSMAGASLGIMQGVVLLAIVAAGNITSAVVMQKDAD